MNRNHIIELQRLEGKQWVSVGKFHAGVNKASGKEHLDGGAVQSQLQMFFDVRCCEQIKDIRLNTQYYRIVYGGGIYKVVDYDDYMERHRNVRLLGVSYRGC